MARKSARQMVVKIEKDAGELSRYGNPPSWTLTYDCGHTASKPHTGDLSTKAMFLRKDPNTYLVGYCKVCV